MADKENEKIKNIQLDLPEEDKIAKVRNQEELSKKLAEFSVVGRKLVETELKRDKKIADAQKSFQGRIESYKKKASKLFYAIMEFSEQNRQQILPEKRKSVKLSNGILGWRTSKPSLRLIVPEEEAILTLKALGLGKYIKVEETVDIEALKKDPATINALSKMVQLFKGQDYFFIEPMGIQTKFTKRMKALAAKLKKSKKE